MGEGGNICSDIPRYRVYEHGVFTKELTDASDYWKEGYVASSSAAPSPLRRRL